MILFGSSWIYRPSQPILFPLNTTFKGDKLVEFYMARIVCLHGVPKNIMFDLGTQFTSRFWKKIRDVLGTQLNFSIAYHPQTNGQTERVN
jgi:transposase InsO family protein